MLVQIDVREDFIHDVRQEQRDDGSTDVEHDLLLEITEAIAIAAPKLDVVVHDAEWAVQRVQDALVPDADEDLVEAVSILRAML